MTAMNKLLAHKYDSEQLIAIAPLLALSTTFISSLAAGTLSLLLILLVAVSFSLIRHFISYSVRIPVIILIIASWMTLIEMGVRAYFYDLSVHLGVYLPLIAINSLVFARAEEFYLRNSVRSSLLNGLVTGFILFFLFLIIGTIREILSYGTLFRDSELIFRDLDAVINLVPVPEFSGLVILQGAPGALLTAGLVLAAWNYFFQQRYQAVS